MVLCVKERMSVNTSSEPSLKPGDIHLTTYLVL